MLDLLTYYRTSFPSDLRTVCALHPLDSTADPDRPELSIVQFAPGSPGAPTDFALETVKEPLAFTLASFWDVLVDQATYTAGGDDSLYSQTGRRRLKLHGILGSFHSHLHPAFLLLAASLYSRPDEAQDITAALTTLVRAESEQFMVPSWNGPRICRDSSGRDDESTAVVPVSADRLSTPAYAGVDGGVGTRGRARIEITRSASRLRPIRFSLSDASMSAAHATWRRRSSRTR
jgi:hypothetical protein